MELREAKKWQSDEELMLGVAEGDGDSLREIADRYQGKLRNFIRRTIHDDGLAQDIVQEVLLKVYQNAGSYDNTRTFSTWLFTIARNTCTDALRRNANRLPVADPTEIVQVDSRPSVVDRVIQFEEHAKLRQWVSELSPGSSTAVDRVYLKEEDRVVVAEDLKITMSTLKTNLRRGIIALRKQYGLTDNLQ